MLRSFEAAQLYWRGQKSYHVSISPYRRTMMENPKVRAIWSEIIRPCFMRESHFTRAIDEYVETLAEPKDTPDKK